MKTKSKTKSSKNHGDSKKNKKSSKSAKKAAREAKRAARKGDGTFPDILVVTREKDKNAEEGKVKHWFLGHGADLDTLYRNGQTVAVYKLRRVSTITINRKVAR